jgi:DNA-binding response OmpR family regulator
MNARILVVEDEELIGTLVRINLENAGCRVQLVEDGAAAVEPVTRGDYDLLLLDLRLPGRSGLDLVRDARRAGVDRPILILTARSAVDTKVQGLGLGADDYLTKPFDVAELIARVEALLRRGR